MLSDRAAALNAPITTERLALEPLTSAHAEAMFAPLQDEAIYEWISAAPPESVDRLREKWARNESRLSPGGADAWLSWAVRRASDGAYLGTMDAVVDDASVATNVGYTFFTACCGRGYATEAVAALCDHLARHGVVELRATVTAGHVASARVLEKAGFVRTRVLPQNDTIRGVLHDDVEYVRARAP